MPKGIPLTEEEQLRRRKEIFDASAHLILEKGFNETSMREIAKAAGIGKSTLYDYFKSKDEILISYFENEIEIINERAQEIVNQDSGASEKIKKIMEMHMEYLIENKKFYLKLTLEAQRLSIRSQKKIQEQRYNYQDILCQLIEDGMRKEEFRPVDPLFASRSILSLLAIAVFTSRPTPSGTPEELFEEASKIFFNGIQA